jgi:deferrochelatase/peroxidase EfeB
MDSDTTRIFRRVLNELQRYSSSGQIDTGILTSLEELNVTELVESLKTKRFSDMRKWTNSNMDSDTTRIFRRVLNELQRYSSSGQIDTGILTSLEELNVTELVESLKTKRFSDMRKWTNSNMDSDTTRIFRKLYDSLSSYLKPQSVPQAVLIIADYQYKSAFVADQEIKMVACLTEIMVECSFK